MPSWPDTCNEVAAQLDQLITRLSAPHRAPLSRRQELGRTLTVNLLSRARHILITAARPTWISNGTRADEAAEWLEQGEYLDPDTLDWPDQ